MEQKIRRQYFNFIIVLHGIFLLFAPYCRLVTGIQQGEFSLPEWLAFCLTAAGGSVAFAVPWILLSICNRRYFGKTVCVLREDGIHHANGRIPWSEIVRIEYIIDTQPRYATFDSSRRCRAVVHTENESVVLLHAPFYTLRAAKRFSPGIETGLAKGSKAWIIGATVLCIVAVPLTLLLQNG